MLRTRTRSSSDSWAPGTEALLSERLDVPDDPAALHELSIAQGWGDGMPLLPPTEDRVRALLAGTPYAPDDLVCMLPPRNGPATVEKVAVNAAMAGCEPDAMPLVIAALEAITAPEFNMMGLATTTSSVFPVLVVNGPTRERLGIDMGAGCMGGAAGRGSATIGRTVALCLRNIGGQKVGETSKSVFGQPARVGGLCFGEWEEESPWPSLAEQRGFAREAEVVTAHGSKGTLPMADVRNDDPHDLLALLARSVAVPTANKYLTPNPGAGETLIAVNPVWAARFGEAFPDVADLQAFVHEHAWQPIDIWPETNQRRLEEQARVDDRGRVHFSARPDQYPIVVCGGHGSLHAVAFPSWGESSIQSAAAVR